MAGQFRTLALASLPAIAANRIPADFETRMREFDGVERGGYGKIIRSFSDRPDEYKTEVQFADGFWLGSCTCPGWGTQQRESDPLPPCAHIGGLLLATEEFIPEDFAELKAFDRSTIGSKVKASGKKDTPAEVDPDEIVFWSSQIPMVEACPASKVMDEQAIIVASKSEAADIGTAVHEICALMVGGAELTEDAMDVVALEHGLDDEAAKRVRIFSYMARGLWRGRKDGPQPLEAHFPEPFGEMRLRHEMSAVNPYTGRKMKLIFTGRLDFGALIAERGKDFKNHLMIGDWKTGRRQSVAKAIGQLKCYAMQALAKYPKVEKVTVVLVWVAERAYDAVTFTRQEIRDWALEFVKRSAFWDGRTYTPGSQCAYCVRALTCPARREMMRMSVAPFMAADFDPQTLLMTPQGEIRPANEIIEAYERATLTGKAAATFLGLVEEQVLLGNDIVDEAGGLALRKVVKKGKETIDPATGWPVLADRLFPEELPQILTVRKGELEKLIKQKAEKGHGAEEVRALYGSLRAAGAIVVGEDSVGVKLLDISEDTEEGEVNADG